MDDRSKKRLVKSKSRSHQSHAKATPKPRQSHAPELLQDVLSWQVEKWYSCLASSRGAVEMNQADKFMGEAIALARQGLSQGGIPIGSVLVRGDVMLGGGFNKRVQHGDPTAHGEIDCLRNVGRQRTYKGTIIYSTLMPCHMCAGAIVQFGIPKVIAGENRTFPSAKKFMESRGVEVIDLDLQECYDLLAEFRNLYPHVWQEDIGED